MTKKDQKNLNQEYSTAQGNMKIIKKLEDKNAPRVLINTLNVLGKERKVLGRSKKVRFISDTALIIIVAIVLSLAVGYLVKNYNIGRNIVLEARQFSESIKSGQIEDFELSYKNNNKEAIKEVNITLEFPENFVLKEINPADNYDAITHTFNLGDLQSGANGKIKFSGLVLGKIDSQQFINFSLNYSSNGLKRSCRHTLIYLIEDSVLALQVSWPAEIYQGSLFSGAISIHNQSADSLENIGVFLDEDLAIQRMDSFSGLSYGSNKLYLNNLAANEKLIINFDALIDDLADAQSFSFQASLNDLEQVNLTKDLLVKVPRFKLAIIPQANFIQAGEKIAFNFNYQNNEEVAIKDLQFEIEPTSSFILSNLALSTDTRFTQEDNKIVFKNNLSPGASGSFQAQLLLHRNQVQLHQQAGIKVIISYLKNEERVQYSIYSPQVKLLSNLSFNSAGYYYSPYGDQLGTGPIPPQVDIPTNYWIFWELENYGNNLSNFSVSADLPPGLVWTNNKSVLAGNLQYGEISRRVIWTIEEIPAQSEKFQVKFEVGLIPEIKDIGQILNLLENIRFFAQDNFCQTQISGLKENINTDLKDDNLVSGKGKVIGN